MATEQQTMKNNGISRAISKLDAVGDLMTVRRVFGDPVQLDGVSVIPVAAVRGGGGGGGGEGQSPEQAAGSGLGAGIGFGVNARPVGVFVIRDGDAEWRPSVDVGRIVLGGQICTLLGIVVIARALRKRRRRR